MKAALEAVVSRSAVNKAAAGNIVPSTMLKHGLTVWLEHGDKPDPKPYLNQQEEHGDLLCNSASRLDMGRPLETQQPWRKLFHCQRGYA